jgi:hypothetical protein
VREIGNNRVLRLCINTLGGSAWRENTTASALETRSFSRATLARVVEPDKVDLSSFRNLTAAINIDVCCCQVTVLLLAECEIEELQAGVRIPLDGRGDQILAALMQPAAFGLL